MPISPISHAFNLAREWGLTANQNPWKVELENLDDTLAVAIRTFQSRDICPEAASEIDDLGRASKLLGHTDKRITETVYRRVGGVVGPTK